MTAEQLTKKLCEKVTNGTDVEISHLINQKADPNRQDAHGKYPIHHACTRGSGKIIALLLEKKASPESEDAHGNTPLMHLAASKTAESRLQNPEGTQKYDLETVLHKLNTTINHKNSRRHGRTALHLACTHQNLGMIDLLLIHKADASLTNDKEETPLKLLDASADSNQHGNPLKDKVRGQLQAALETRRAAAELCAEIQIQNLIQKAQKEETLTTSIPTSLSRLMSESKLSPEVQANVLKAVTEKKFEQLEAEAIGRMQTLITAKATLGITSEQVEVIYTYAVDQHLKSKSSILKLLLEKRVLDHLTLIMPQRQMPISEYAARNGHVEAFSALYSACNFVINKRGDSLLHVAAYKVVKPEIMRRIIADAKPAKLQTPNTKSGRTALHRAVTEDNLAAAKALLAAKADVRAKDKKGQTPLDLAKELLPTSSPLRALLSNRDNLENVFCIAWDGIVHRARGFTENLLDAKMPVNFSNFNKTTLLHVASLHCRGDVIKILIAAKADVNAMNSDGDTPLHYAVMNDDGLLSAHMARLLINGGADPHAHYKSAEKIGFTPLDKAYAKSLIKAALLEKPYKKPLIKAALLPPAAPVLPGPDKTDTTPASSSTPTKAALLPPNPPVLPGPDKTDTTPASSSTSADDSSTYASRAPLSAEASQVYASYSSTSTLSESMKNLSLSVASSLSSRRSARSSSASMPSSSQSSSLSSDIASLSERFAGIDIEDISELRSTDPYLDKCLEDRSMDHLSMLLMYLKLNPLPAATTEDSTQQTATATSSGPGSPRFMKAPRKEADDAAMPPYVETPMSPQRKRKPGEMEQDKPGEDEHTHSAKLGRSSQK